MGNYKFTLSDMIRPNAWFHKKHTKTSCTDSSSSNAIAAAAAVPKPNQCPNNQQPHLSDPRKSYRFTQLINTNKFPVEPPRISSRRQRRSTKINRPLHNQNLAQSVSASCSCRATRKTPVSTPEQYPYSNSSSDLDSMLNEYGSEHTTTLTPDTFDAMLSCSASSCKCRTVHNSILLDTDNKTGQFRHKVPELAPIITNNHNHHKTSVQKTNTSPGFKMRANSPRIANKRIQVGRKSAARGSVYAVVKTSRDPRRDFRESMVEMIVEKNIMGSSKDLEQLLACYLSLNSDEYHDIIISVFKQIWFDFIHVTTK